MNYLYIGKLVNTHGIKGEVRILSNFRHKDKVFVKGFKFYVGKDKKEYVVETYRKHKNFDMVVFKDNYDINLIEHLLLQQKLLLVFQCLLSRPKATL